MKIVLKKVHIQNFKNIKDMAIDFTDRTTVKGQNGLGKTTVADAVMWVLFNKNSEGSQADKIRPHDVNGKDIDFIEKSIKSESIKLSSLPTESELLDKNDQYNSLSEKIKTLEKELETTDTGAELRQQLRIKKLGFKEQLRECESVLAKSSANDIAEERIEELKAKQVELAQSIATFEKEKYLLDQFTKTKISILTDEINKNFKLVQWKLFETQINGGYKEICEPTVNGTPYNYGLNAGHKILSELDIINTLQKINDVQVPVFLDNAERLSDNNIPTTDCQLIVLKVSDDTKLVSMDEPFKHNCSNCANLDKSRKRQVGICYQYGCRSNHKYPWNEHNTGWIPCWIGNDDLLEDCFCGK